MIRPKSTNETTAGRRRIYSEYELKRLKNTSMIQLYNGGLLK
jgi:hypothetical protein